MSFLTVLSAIFGWVYFTCWSLSFYPQPILNWRRKSTSGTTIDFPFTNCLGFAAYFLSNVLFYYSPTVRAQYAARNRGLTPTVQFNDIVFALHGLVLSLITTSQYLFRTSLWGFQPATGTRPSRLMSGVQAGCVAGVLLTCLVVAFAPGSSSDDSAGRVGGGDPTRDWCALDIVYALGYVKLVITLVKYTPQLVANWRNRSTRGWSIGQILLDFTGGVLSVTQQAIDSWLQRDWSGITGNPVKFALGNVSMLYDVAFMTQHYVLYGDKDDGEEERRSLLHDEERRID